jgi:RHS repeat-associated protein
VTAGSGYNSSLTIIPVSNQISGYTYDQSGNVTAQPAPLSATFSYDGEECLTNYTGNGNTATYTCDGNGVRVKKVDTGTNAVTTVYLRVGNDVIAEYDNGAAVASPTREYILGANRVATITGSVNGSGGTITYEHRDHLSPRLFTDSSGNNVGEQGTYPFGESWYSNNSTSQWVFTTYERDKESGNDYALARSYSGNLGRFVAPDPLDGVVGDPQSWNRYAYVENDPIDFADPNGQGFWSDFLNAILEIISLGQASLNNGPSFTNGEPGGGDGGCPDFHHCSLQFPPPAGGNGGGNSGGPPKPGPGSGNGPGGANDPASTGNNPDGSLDKDRQGPTGGGVAGTNPNPRPSDDPPISAMQTHVTIYNKPTWIKINLPGLKTGVWFIGNVYDYQIVTRTGRNYLGGDTVTEHFDDVHQTQNVERTTTKHTPIFTGRGSGKFSDAVGETLGQDERGPEPLAEYYYTRSIQTFTVEVGGSTHYLQTKVAHYVVGIHGRVTAQALVIVP